MNYGTCIYHMLLPLFGEQNSCSETVMDIVYVAAEHFWLAILLPILDYGIAAMSHFHILQIWLV